MYYEMAIETIGGYSFQLPSTIEFDEIQSSVVGSIIAVGLRRDWGKVLVSVLFLYKLKSNWISFFPTVLNIGVL